MLLPDDETSDLFVDRSSKAGRYDAIHVGRCDGTVRNRETGDGTSVFKQYER